jgi:hypothetical protein
VLSHPFHKKREMGGAPGKSPKKHPSGAKARVDFTATCGTTKEAAENLEGLAKALKNVPQGLKPALILQLLAARLKSCPFKTLPQHSFFRSLSSRALSKPCLSIRFSAASQVRP